MDYTFCGKTGMKVPRLSFGASSLGGVFRSIRESDAIEAVFTAVRNGLNFIDVSPYYGHYKAETVLGKALKELPAMLIYFQQKLDATVMMVSIRGIIPANGLQKVFTKVWSVCMLIILI